MTYSETLKHGRKRFTYVDVKLSLAEAKRILIDDEGMMNVHVTESSTWAGRYLRVYVT